MPQMKRKYKKKSSPVANVNKDTTTREGENLPSVSNICKRNASKDKKNELNCTKRVRHNIVESNNDHETDHSDSQGSSESRSKRKSSATRSSVVRATFVEDDQTVTMEVPGDEELFPDDVSDKEDKDGPLDLKEDSINNNASTSVQKVQGRSVRSRSKSPAHTLNVSISEEQQEAIIGTAVSRTEQMIQRSGLLEVADLLKQHFGSPSGNVGAGKESFNDGNQNTHNSQRDLQQGNSQSSQSEVTIYHNAVEDRTGERHFSSSSDEGAMNVSNETMDADVNLNGPNQVESIIEKFIAENRIQYRRRTDDKGEKSRSPMRQMSLVEEDPDPQPSTSRDMDRVDRLICDAENNRARILQTPGNVEAGLNIIQNAVYSAIVDESYMVVAAHVDQLMKDKICKGEYVDFAELIPKDRVFIEDDGRMQLVVKNGQTYWTSVQDTTAINSFHRWEVAFRVFSDIYS